MAVRSKGIGTLTEGPSGGVTGSGRNGHVMPIICIEAVRLAVPAVRAGTRFTGLEPAG